MAEGQGFLARWSRLKKAAAQNRAAAEQPAEPPPAELPPVESLTGESDFSPFMQPGVPDSLRNAALQKLWRSDPVYANLDGLVEYGEDFAADFNAAAAVATAYRVLEGMPDGDEPVPEEAPAAAQPAVAAAQGPKGPAAADNESHEGDPAAGPFAAPGAPPAADGLG